MFNDDPLEFWMIFDRQEMPAEHGAAIQADLRKGLDRLEDYLDHPPARRRNLMDAFRMGWGADFIGYAPADQPRAQALYRRIVEAGGTGSQYVQGEMLKAIVASDDPAMIPFWLELLDLRRPRDRFASQRRTLVLAALARMAVRRDAPAAYAALHGAIRHATETIRAEALYYLGQAYLFQLDEDSPRTLPAEVAAELAQVAMQDPVFGPRFQARAVLREAELPIPLDNGDGVYAFKVRLTWAKGVSRTIEVRSTQTLDDLHFAIQRAYAWDSDHLYSFYMTGEEDDRYRFSCPYEDDHPPWTDEAVIGELGLVTGQKFLYYFDYGDGHKFEVTVTGIRPKAEEDKYPRLVDSLGKAPEQYPNWEE